MIKAAEEFYWPPQYEEGRFTSHVKHVLKLDVKMLPTFEKLVKLTVEKMKFFVKPHVFLLAYSFFYNGFPDYELIDDKPNLYDSNLESLPKLSFHLVISNSLLCLDFDASRLKTVACEGRLSFDYVREHVVSAKSRL